MYTVPYNTFTTIDKYISIRVCQVQLDITMLYPAITRKKEGQSRDKMKLLYSTAGPFMDVHPLGTTIGGIFK